VRTLSPHDAASVHGTAAETTIAVESNAVARIQKITLILMMPRSLELNGIFGK
jgi:hypothetical protein